MTKNTLPSVPFDPGFMHFFPAIDNNIFSHLLAIQKLKAVNQRKFQLLKIEKDLTEKLTQSLCIYYGCLIYGSTIANKYTTPPAIITGNPINDVSPEEQEKVDLTIEASAMAELYKLFNRCTEHTLKRKSLVPENFLEVINSYNEFMLINNHFINLKSTDQLKIPGKYSHFAGYSKEKLDKIESNIYKSIEAGRLTDILNIS